MEFDYLDLWQAAAGNRSYEIEHDANMDVWFAWKGDECMGAFNIENRKGDLKL